MSQNRRTARGSSGLLIALRRALSSAGNPTVAAGMQAYMRSEMPFHGVHAPEGRRICSAVFSGLSFESRGHWESVVRDLWDRSKFREERYGVIFLARSPRSQPFQDPQALPLYGHLISSGAWWDYVDEIAIHLVGPIYRAFPRRVDGLLRRWSRSPDRWKRRASIICQVGSKSETNRDLLADCIAPSLASREFFLRKAIGWALRQESQHNPAWVVRFVAAHEGDFSPLSRKEALRRLPS